MRLALRFFRGDRGSSAAEFALVLPIFLLFLLGLIDVGRYAWAINEAEKATQIGARWAVVTDMIPTGMANYSFAIDGGVPQGNAIGQDEFNAVFDGGVRCAIDSAGGAASLSCACKGGGGCAVEMEPATAAFGTLVSRMRQIYPALSAENVVVDYDYSSLGFSGDPNGPDVAPLVTVGLRNMSFPMFFMLGGTVKLPSFSYSLTLEDANGNVSN